MRIGPYEAPCKNDPANNIIIFDFYIEEIRNSQQIAQLTFDEMGYWADRFTQVWSKLLGCADSQLEASAPLQHVDVTALGGCPRIGAVARESRSESDFSIT